MIGEYSLKSDQLDSRRWTWPALIGVWLVMVLASTGADSLNTTAEWPFERILLYFTLAWAPWLPLLPALFLLPSRLPLTRLSRWRTIGVVFALSLLWLGVMSLWMPAVQVVMQGGGWDEYLERIPRPLAFGSFYDWSLFVAAVAVVYAIDFGWRYLAERQRAANLETELREARLTALSAQLRPHFLFNALNAATSCARTGDGETAANLLEGLAELLRYALDTASSGTVELSREWKMAEHYLTIQGVRFVDRLRVSVGPINGFEDIPVPPMILQPLVENAVCHGAERHEGQSRIDLSVKLSGKRIQIAIRNTLGEGDMATGFGVGLDNVRARLWTLYGDEADLQGMQADGEWQSTLTLPSTGPS